MATYDKPKLLLIAQITAKATWAKAHAIWGDAIGKLPTIEMNARLTSTAGRAFMLTAKNRIDCPTMIEKMDFSYYLMVNNHDEFISQIIPHECAHFIAMRIYGDENHGKGFYYVMQELGCRPEHCHPMQTKSMAEKGIKPRKRITSGA